jgi:hypothetical protein
MQAEGCLNAGVELLTPLLASRGFSFVPLTSGKSSGGWSASGEFRRDRDDKRRRLELHFRHSLGLVTCHVGAVSLRHIDYMRALKARNQYPGFSDDPIDGFRHLLYDLEHYASDFLDGPGDEFARCLREAKRLNAVPGFKRLSE